ncbi:MAG: phenylalanine--tRNA ligase subunit beta [Pirellulales bacterium]|nr:phenylalanine--tRNA ligase subunit beta [Pirellulales bacterium]
MIVSWNWLKDYLPLDLSADEFARRLMMAGLNHESTEPRGDDLAIDLEVTSNRPDCLGHLGIAREAAVLFGQELKTPPAQVKEAAASVNSLAKVRVECPQLCPHYTARVIRGVQVGPSPRWLVNRLATIGVAAINNVVDVTNYVLFECGQPLHAFDLAKLNGPEIIVREPRAGEKLEAIDHKTYDLAPGMCVIADASRAVAIGGIMGGAATEVSSATKNLLIEAAVFSPANVRATARKLGLHSDSSYRFERGVDLAGVDWASRRCCELILELAGGELAAGVIAVGVQPPPPPSVVLRLSQIKRLLGIEIPPDRVRDILSSLGNQIERSDQQSMVVVPPTWRRDLSREVDLIEEVARVHGYDAIPEDVQVPMVASAKSLADRVVERVRGVMTARGFDEAYTLSVVDESWSEAFSPWTDAPPLVSSTPILRRADRLRRSLAPSLLGARRANESLSNSDIELFEIAKIYLPRPAALPQEQLTLAFTTAGDFLHAKGALQSLLDELHVVAAMHVEPFSHRLFERGRAAQIRLGDQLFGYLGEVSPAGRKEFDLRGAATVAEVRLQALLDLAQLVPQYHRTPQFPAIERDVNLVVAENVAWSAVEQTARQAGGRLLESVAYRDTYRDAQRLGAAHKSLLFSLVIRDPEGTLTSQAADAVRDQIVAAASQRFGAVLRAS